MMRAPCVADMSSHITCGFPHAFKVRLIIDVIHFSAGEGCLIGQYSGGADTKAPNRCESVGGRQQRGNVELDYRSRGFFLSPFAL